MENESKRTQTLRLLMPQWQGGNNPDYPLGARLLAWLAPQGEAPLVEVPVTAYTGQCPPLEDGVVGRTVLLEQLRAARQILEDRTPDRVVVFGGDCHVSQAPFAYLNARHGGDLGVLWIDAHPDVSTPEIFPHEHAMVLGNLLGGGDPAFAREVPIPLQPARVMFAGLQQPRDTETPIIARFGLRQAGPRELANDSAPVLAWLKETGIRHLAIHLDLDVLDPALFRSLLFANPNASPADFDGVAQGEMTLAQVARLVADVSAQTDVVGLAIAEHLPWDAINLQKMLTHFPILH